MKSRTIALTAAFIAMMFIMPCVGQETGGAKDGAGAAPKVEEGKAAPKKDDKSKKGGKAPELTGAQKKQANDLMSMFNEKLKHRFAPVVKDMQFGAAKVGSPVPVTVTAGYGSPSAKDKIVTVEVYYSADNGGTFDGPVTLAPSGAGTFKGSIPAFKKAGDVLAYAVVTDSFGNVGTQLPCKVKTWPPFEDGCMVPGAVDPKPSDDPAALIEDDYDVWETQIGMDDKYVYITTDVEGDVVKGTMNPPHANAYISMLMDTESLYQFSDISALMDPGQREKMMAKADMAVLVMYVPIGPAISSEMKACSIPRFGKAAGGDKPAEKSDGKAEAKAEGTAEGKSEGKAGDKGGKDKGGGNPMGMLDSEHVKCTADGSDLFMRIDKSIINDKMKNSFSVIGSITGFSDNFQAPIPKIRDFTAVTNVAFKPHKFTVK